MDALSNGVLRSEHKLYASASIHITLIELIFSLMITPLGTLEHLYSDQFPLNAKKLNIPFLLRMHLNHPSNRSVIPELAKKTREAGPDEYRCVGCVRLFWQRTEDRDSGCLSSCATALSRQTCLKTCIVWPQERMALSTGKCPSTW